MAPVSPWFYKHLTPGAGGNYIYRSDDFLLATRFEQLIAMDTLPDFIEVISWNVGRSVSLSSELSTDDNCIGFWRIPLHRTDAQRGKLPSGG